MAANSPVTQNCNTQPDARFDAIKAELEGIRALMTSEFANMKAGLADLKGAIPAVEARLEKRVDNVDRKLELHKDTTAKTFFRLVLTTATLALTALGEAIYLFFAHSK